MTKKFVRKINKRSVYSYSINLPKEIIAMFRWRDNQKVEIKIFGKNKILIKDWEPKKKNKK